jgi:hypothetical protein
MIISIGEIFGKIWQSATFEDTNYFQTPSAVNGKDEFWHT